MTTTKDGPSQASATAALLLLIAINLFNYIDRQVLAAVEPEIRAELLPADPNPGGSQFKLGKMGLLSFAFVVTYMLLAPVFGWLADRFSRWKIVGLGVILWSLASGASGLEWTTNLAAAYWILLVTRCFVGVGEGAYGPVAPAMIADLYPVHKRGRVMAWFYLAIPVGGALGYAFGEIVKNAIDWRWAFYLVVPPGLFLGVLCFFMKEPRRGQSDVGIPDSGARFDKATWRLYRDLFRIPSYALNTLGMTMMTFAIGGIAWWMPAYLDARQVQPMGVLGPRTVFGIITALAGFFATMAGGLLGDLLKPRFSGSYFLVSGLAMLLGFPAFLAFLYTPFPYAWIFVFVSVFCLFFNTGPTNTILANVTHPSVRAGAFALNILVIHLLGDAISPFVVGVIADQSSLHVGFLFVSGAMVLGGVAWLWGTRFLAEDTRLAGSRVG
jgi:MFS family permease